MEQGAPILGMRLENQHTPVEFPLEFLQCRRVI
jgi:hypothetical protein